MISLQTFVSALVAFPAVLAAPHQTLTSRGAPQTYSGPASSFPAMSEWTDFNTIVCDVLKDLLEKRSDLLTYVSLAQ